ncbi:MAG: hypothetical protein HYV42_02430 [Candidatus Magasanikbacteria bacterium]|nr:hypothetical protein [Candidatus Magasanikbacteria bacterium]
MDEKKKIILDLKIAELQFRLAVAVRLATTRERQPLDVPTKWSHGKHFVTYEEIALRKDQAEIAAQYLEQTSTYLMSLAIKETLKKTYKDPKNHTDNNVVAAYQIARLIRNAFAHSPIRPVWSINPDCRDQVFVISDIISLNTAALDGKPFDWRHYGGLLALFRLSKYVRIDLLGDMDTGKNRSIPKPKREIIKQGDLILEQIDKIPDDAVRVDPAKFTEETGIKIVFGSDENQ